MFRNYLAVALRNLVRNRLYAAISIAGLALGICAAILMGLVIYNQVTYNRFILGYKNTYLLVSETALKPFPMRYGSGSQNFVAALLKLQVPEVASVTRLGGQDLRLTHGPVTAIERIYWADPNAFDLLPLPVYAGDLAAALRRPDGIVITRSVAQKYFGEDSPLGQSLDISILPGSVTAQTPAQPPGPHPFTVMAVIQDLPANGTTLETGIFVSGLSPASRLSALDATYQPGSANFALSVNTYIRPAPGASLDRVQERVAAVDHGVMPGIENPEFVYSSRLLRLDRIRLDQGLNPGIINRLAMEVVTGALVLFAGCINFINLATARAVRRAVEVGVRKASGAERRALTLQFLGEAGFHVALSTAVALVLAVLLLPAVNAFLGTGASAGFWHSPVLIGAICAGVVTVALLSGAYPAFVLSGFHPARILKGLESSGHGGSMVRQVLVTLQFAGLIGFFIAAGVVFRQRDFATHDALRIQTDQVLSIQSPCNPAFTDELRKLAGVRAVSCTDRPDLAPTVITRFGADNGPEAVARVSVDADILDVLQVPLLGGRFLPPGVEAGREAADKGVVPNVINETAMRRLGFSTPEAAIGQVFTPRFAPKGVEIVGVVADFSLTSVEQRIEPTFYYTDSNQFRTIQVRLSGQDIPETLSAMDRLWRATGATEPMQRTFMNDRIQSLYAAILREGQVLAIYAGLAVFLGCLGLVGLSAATTERRTKEIGVRKALGARNRDIVRLLVAESVRPVLWANAMAWPLGYLAMRRWLEGFAYHVNLEPWLFLAASALALGLAIITVACHAVTVARAEPVTALRYE